MLRDSDAAAVGGARACPGSWTDRPDFANGNIGRPKAAAGLFKSVREVRGDARGHCHGFHRSAQRGQPLQVREPHRLVLTIVPTALFVSTAMQSARTEAQVVAPAKALLRVIQLTQEHRSAGAGWR